MKFLGYILARSIIWLLYLLPRRILYILSDILFLIVYYLTGYRKKVVLNNLSMAFPDHDKREIRKIARRFYHHLCDVILESAVAHFLSEKQSRDRINYINPELLKDIYEKGKLVIGVTAHYGNWEYLSTLGLVTDYKVYGVYKPLKNKYFDRMIRDNRKKFGVIPVPMEQIVRKMIASYRDKIPVLSIFLSDQRPIFQNIQYWTKFLGLDTPLYLGTEKLARKLNAAVVFFKISKIRRGKYQVEFELICEDPSTMEPYEITEMHVRILEKQIIEKPELWLWSHRRWKHSIEKFRKEREENLHNI